jgi:hypothetical protein
MLPAARSLFYSYAIGLHDESQESLKVTLLPILIYFTLLSAASVKRAPPPVLLVRGADGFGLQALAFVSGPFLA